MNSSDNLTSPKKAIIFHGGPDEDEYYSEEKPSSSNDHWIPWLSNQLLVKGMHAIAPEVYEAHLPTYEKYLTELQRYEVGSQTILVGHSCGAGFLVRWLSENPDVEVDRVVLVAPYLKTASEGGPKSDVFNFDINSTIGDQCQQLTIFSSSNDQQSVQDSVAKLLAALKQDSFKHIEFQDYGHFCKEDIGVEFPELLAEVTLIGKL